MRKLLFLILFISFASFGQDYFESGLEKYENGDTYGAIADYTKAIEINPNNAAAYNNRGFSKAKLNDYNGATADFTKAIEINPNHAKAYFNRCVAKIKLGDKNGACQDARKTQDLGYDASELIRIACK